jgi:hypothetical protein
MWGSLGIIEEFFGAELVKDNEQRSRMATVITPERIMQLPKVRREALASALEDFDKGSAATFEDFRSSLGSSQQGARRPTMLIGRDWLPVNPWYTVDQGLRVVAYFRRVFVDEPFNAFGLRFELSDYGPDPLSRTWKG